jgi:hypothetical protein
MSSDSRTIKNDKAPGLMMGKSLDFFVKSQYLHTKRCLVVGDIQPPEDLASACRTLEPGC